MLTDEQIEKIMLVEAGGKPDKYFPYTLTTIDLCRAIESEVREEQAGEIARLREANAELQTALERLSATGEECEFNDQSAMVFPLDEWNDFEDLIAKHGGKE